jgi:O-antigen ligase
MDLNKLRRYLLERGIVHIYMLFMAGYFLLPMAAGHRRLYFIMVLPALLLLWRDLLAFYRGNTLFLCMSAYSAYMITSLAWTEDFATLPALLAVALALAPLTFCALSGYLWIQYPQRMDRLAHRGVWLAAATACVSILAWYWGHPFPHSRLEPLGVMHHPNKAACAYGMVFLFGIHYFFSERGRSNRALYFSLAAILMALIILTQSRTALLAACLGMLALAGLRALGVIAFGMAASWALLAGNPKEWWHRVGEFSFRPGIWTDVLNNMGDSWIFGRGLLVDTGVFAYDKEFTHAHNSYIATLRDGGWLGLFLLLLVLGVALVWATRMARERGERIYLAMILYAMTCIAMDYDRLLIGPRELWLFFWLPLALTMAAYPHRQDPGLLRYRSQH